MTKGNINTVKREKKEGWKTCKHDVKILFNNGEPYAYCPKCNLSHWISNADGKFTNEQMVKQLKKEYNL